MNNRNCPDCGNPVSRFKLLIMGPAKEYACSACNASLTVSPTSNRILIYGGLLFFTPRGAFLQNQIKLSFRSDADCYLCNSSNPCRFYSKGSWRKK